MEFTGPMYPGTMEIPVDFFISKKHPGLVRGEVGFANAYGDIVFKFVHIRFPESALHRRKRVLLDAAGNPLISICQSKSGSWQGYRCDGNEERKELLFRVERKLHKFNKTELDVYFGGEIREELVPDFKMKGLPFQKSCTIYKGNAIVAQTSFMYKLNQIFVERGKFRVTIFPGLADHDLVAALIIVFFYGKKITAC